MKGGQKAVRKLISVRIVLESPERHRWISLSLPVHRKSLSRRIQPETMSSHGGLGCVREKNAESEARRIRRELPK